MSTFKGDVSNWDPKQLEIKYFFPLTEQIPLDLDYTDCEKKYEWICAPIVGGTGLVLMSSNMTNTWAQPAGHWAQVHEETPSRFQKWIAKKLLGMKWMGK